MVSPSDTVIKNTYTKHLPFGERMMMVLVMEIKIHCFFIFRLQR